MFDVDSFLCSGVIFDDDSEVCGIDAIILATGYKIGFPCLDEGLVPVEKNQVPLYKYVFPYDHKQHTMAIIGCFQPIGAIMPLSELQTRWACKIFSGERHLPSNEEMKEEVECKKKAMAQRYYNSERHTIQVALHSLACGVLVILLEAEICLNTFLGGGMLCKHLTAGTPEKK